MRLGDIPGFGALARHQQEAVARAGRIVRLPVGAPVVVGGLPADLTWILLEGELVEHAPDGAPLALLRPVSVVAAGARTASCATPAKLLAVPVRELGPAPPLAARVESPAPEAPAARHDIELSVGWLREDPPRDLLEVGAGAGLYSRFLLGVSDRVTITDPVDEALRVAGERLRWGARAGAQVRAVRGTGEAIAAPDGSFDAVATRMAMHHMDSAAGFLAEARRVLRPHGRLLAIDLLAPEDAAARALVDERERRLDPSHRGVLARSHVDALLREAGFALERFEVTTVRTSLRDLARRGGRPAAAAESIAGWLAGRDADRAALRLVSAGAGDAEWVDERFVLLARRGP